MASDSPRIDTLTKRRDFLAAARARKAVTKGLIVQRRERKPDETPDAITRVGYTASKKVGNAVLRNRAKRRMRAVVRDVLGEHGAGASDIVLIARNGATVERPYDALRGDLEYALRKLTPAS